MYNMSPSMPIQTMPSIWYSIYFRVFSRIYRIHIHTRTRTHKNCIVHKSNVCPCSHGKVVRLDGWIVGWLAGSYEYMRICTHELCASVCAFLFIFRQMNLTICHFHATDVNSAIYEIIWYGIAMILTCAQSNISHFIHISI